MKYYVALLCWISVGLSISDGLSFPSKVKVDQNGKPRLASLVSKVIGVGTRVSLCSWTAQEFTVNVEARSNRDVLCGNLEEITVNVKQSKGPILKLSELVIHGKSLKLGWWPTILTALPFVWWTLRPSLFTVLLCFGGYKLYCATCEHYAQQFSQRSTFSSKRVRKHMGGEPCFLQYQVSLSEDDVNQSKLFRLGLNLMLRSMMLNSVLGEAATAADTFNMFYSTKAGKGTRVVSERRNNRNLLLSPASEGQSQKALSPEVKEEKVLAKQEVMLSKLLEATTFQLTKTTFANGRMFWNADAIFPQSNGETRLSYVLRTMPKAEVVNQNRALAFCYPECQFSLGATIGGPLQRFIPDVWLPVGPGVALLLGSYHRIRQLDIDKGICRIHGDLSLFEQNSYGPEDSENWENMQTPLPFIGKGNKRQGKPLKSLRPAEEDDA